jgi:hypothetical protein
MPFHRFRPTLNEFEVRVTPSTTYDDSNTEHYQITAYNNAAIQPIISFDKLIVIKETGKIAGGTLIRVKVVAADGTVYDETFKVPKDMTEQQSSGDDPR